MNQSKLLLIDDDSAIHMIVKSLGPELDLLVETAAEGRLGISMVESNEYAAVILDLGLPDLGGIAVLKHLRAKFPALPIVLMTSRAADVDIVLGLEMGADDYITKPFTPQELVARIRSLLRRKQAYTRELVGDDSAESAELRFGELRVQLQQRQIFLGSKLLELTALEFDVLAYLITNRSRVVSREELLEKVWGYSSNAVASFDATVTTHLSRLRSKLEPGADSPKRITTIRGVGYRFLEDPSA